MENAVSLLCYTRYRGKNCKISKNCHDNAQAGHSSFLKNLLIFNKFCNVYVLNAVPFLYK